MKWLIWGATFGLIILFGLSTMVSASTNDFRFASMDADYYLGSDSQGRSTLKTVEKLTAEFPSYDQNHGIERAIPKDYDGHTTSLNIQSVSDGSGKRLNYSTFDNSGNEVIRIGDTDTYVHGIQNYVITYTQRDVTGVFNDTNDNEFYWDTNGLQWPQSFGTVTARVHISDSLRPTFTNKIACYQGIKGSTADCDISAKGNIVTARATNLKPYENMTVVVGFTLGTFRGYQPSLWDIIVGFWILSLIVTSLLGLLTIFWLTHRYRMINNRVSEMKPIPVEYIPPNDVSVLLAAQIGGDTKADTTAQLIDLAVRHYIIITQTKEKSLWKPAEYELEIVKTVDVLSEEEKDFIKALFGDSSVGTKRQTKSLKNNYSISAALQKNAQMLTKRIKENYELRAKDRLATRRFKRIGIIIVIISIVTWSPVVLIAAITSFICGWMLNPLTDKGLDLRRYLVGLERYIEVAEKDRIKMLQSPEGVEKTGIKVSDGSDKKLIKLYERVLPYAILFGQEKQWNKQLALHYEANGASPDWYVGHSALTPRSLQAA